MSMEAQIDFKVGDRVICTKDSGEFKITGLTGTIMAISLRDTMCVEFDEFIDGHSCQGVTKVGHGLYVLKRNLQLLKDETSFLKFKDWKKRKSIK